MKKSIDKKSAILKSVLKLVNREGFYHLNMKKIAQEAGVAAGTIYLYFKGKEELINALYDLAISEFNQTVINQYDERKGIKENFENMLFGAVNFYILHPDHFSFIEQYTYAPFIFKENREQNFTLLRPVYKLLREGKEQNLIKKVDDEILISIIHGSINTIVKLFLAKKYDLNDTNKQTLYSKTIWESITYT